MTRSPRPWKHRRPFLSAILAYPRQPSKPVPPCSRPVPAWLIHSQPNSPRARGLSENPLEWRGKLLSRLALECGCYGAREIGGPEGLAQHGRRPAAVATHARNLSTSGHDQGLDAGTYLAGALDQLRSGHASQVHIDDQQVDRGVGRKDIERRGPAVREQNVTAETDEALLSDREEVWIVIHHKNGGPPLRVGRGGFRLGRRACFCLGGAREEELDPAAAIGRPA